MRKLKRVMLYEKRSGPGSEGWPHCLQFEFEDGWPTSVTLAERAEYSEVAAAIEAINAALSATESNT